MARLEVNMEPIGHVSMIPYFPTQSPRVITCAINLLGKIHVWNLDEIGFGNS